MFTIYQYVKVVSFKEVSVNSRGRTKAYYYLVVSIPGRQTKFEFKIAKNIEIPPGLKKGSKIRLTLKMFVRGPNSLDKPAAPQFAVSFIDLWE